MSDKGKTGDRLVSVVGLGYVGLPVAVAFGKIRKTIGFDINRVRIEELKKNSDRTGEVEPAELQKADILFTDRIDDLRKADFHIVAIPTPVDQANRPDLSMMFSATETVGKALKKGDIVVYESTVYPGATEEECLPILERVSGLKGGIDFKVGYSPERINPGDKEHTFTRILKIVSGQDQETLDIVADVYASVVTAGVHKASSIKVAEAAKVIENTQRDLNISLMNELALIFDRMGIDTRDVLDAAGTKWNFLKFSPGLVGGHCIGVDPYYLTHKAEKVGYIPQVILAGRRINDSMAKFIAQKTIKMMIQAGHPIQGAVVTVFGITFKEECSDIRNSKVIDIIHELREYGVKVQVYDPLADSEEVQHEYGIRLSGLDRLEPAQAEIFAVAHQPFKTWGLEKVRKMAGENPVLIDVKHIFNPREAEKAGFRFWRL
ncbi:MAG TPA: nucleotide sugar dehydrogenase [Nitrospiria bacterium]|nr:nucleotide sugar dehydrogenase [Nitrospiria bacterium]